MVASRNLQPWFETARCARLLTMRPSVLSSCQSPRLKELQPRNRGSRDRETRPKNWVPASAGTNGAGGDSRSFHLALARPVDPRRLRHQTAGIDALVDLPVESAAP